MNFLKIFIEFMWINFKILNLINKQMSEVSPQVS